ncbi:4-(cytidine 5'-diphospho)-2-C-methyl-D-erythritol kinase [Aristophania vespae]|uniref:4-(cytidine 5'-diphospho)-2-C-methyl-D-erythritol kinase n=1 Tax=Aristophania vespae TaxID=2697033 RepID=UPI001F0252F4|nr:4-(cytidine 5'-diphospho)-2-C-methyl-D-erythritol kinase [Aristophania vespae]
MRAEPNNLVLKAAEGLKQKYYDLNAKNPPPVHFTLEKNLPVSSGIGGGSADAASALRLLTHHWNMPPQAASDLAPSLGADIPVCFVQETVRIEGIGEILSPVPPLPSMGMILLNPKIAVSTPTIFKNLALPVGVSSSTRTDFPTQSWKDLEEFIAFLSTTRNDLQAPAIKQVPVIADMIEILSDLPDSLFARMSGSGATCFALFKTKEQALKAQAILMKKDITRSWWCWAGKVRV